VIFVLKDPNKTRHLNVAYFRLFVAIDDLDLQKCWLAIFKPLLGIPILN
jgi:hypothetical protein